MFQVRLEWILGNFIEYKVSLPCQRVWNKVIFYILSNPNCSVLLSSCVQPLLAGFQSYLQLLPSQQHQDFICPLTDDKCPPRWQCPASLSPACSQASSRQLQ